MRIASRRVPCGISGLAESGMTCIYRLLQRTVSLDFGKIEFCKHCPASCEAARYASHAKINDTSISQVHNSLMVCTQRVTVLLLKPSLCAQSFGQDPGKMRLPQLRLQVL